MRAAEYRFCQRGGFKQVVPAVRHQTAADKSAVSQGIEKQQLAHGVAEQHARLRIDIGPGRATYRGETFALAQVEHRIETLGMTRHQNQQRIGMTAQQTTMGVEHHFVFALVGTRSDPHWTLQRLPLATQFGCTLQQLRVDGQVELDRTSDFNGFRTRAEIAEALGLGFGLHRQQAHLGEHRRSEFAEATIAFGRTLRQPPIGQRHRNPALGTLMNMVRPQLGLHDHCEPGLHAIKKTRRRTRQVVGQITVLDARLVGEQCLNPLRTGRGHAGHGDRQRRIAFQQRADHRRGGNAFAHRHRVHPDAAGLQGRHAISEALANTLGIRRRLARAQPQPNRHQWQPQVKQRGVESSIHGGGVYRLLSPIARKCTAKRSASQRAAGPSGSSRRQTSSTTSAGGVHSLSSSIIWP